MDTNKDILQYQLKDNLLANVLKNNEWEIDLEVNPMMTPNYKLSLAKFELENLARRGGQLNREGKAINQRGIEISHRIKQ